MGCGIIKTKDCEESDNINQSELLPVVQVNQVSNLSNSNINNNKENSIIKNENENENKSEIINNSQNFQESNKILKSFKSSKISSNTNKSEEEKKKEINSYNENKNKPMSEPVSNIEIYENGNEKEDKEEKVEKEDNEEKEEKEEKENINIDNKIINKEINCLENRLEKLSKDIFKKRSNTIDIKEKIKSKNSMKVELSKVIQISNSSENFLGRNVLEFDLQASRYDKICPIWIQKDEEIEFIVQGKWKINKEIECDSRGIKLNKNRNDVQEGDDNNKNNFNDGALIGRVIKGEPFVIFDKLKYVSKISGPLILKMNLNSISNREQPEGTLKIKIYGARKIQNNEDLEDKIGWWKQLKVIEFNNKEHLPNYTIQNNEKSIIILLNKARHDSKLFASQYLDNFQRLTPSTKRIYEQLMTNKDQYIPFKINLSIIKLLKKFYYKFIDDNNTYSEEEWNSILKSEESLLKYLQDSFNSKKKLFLSILRYYEDNPFYLGLRILFRDNIRDNILSYNIEEISMLNLSYNLNGGKNVYYCIVVISNKNGNDNVNYDVDMNFEKFIEDENLNSKVKEILKQ